MFTPMAVFTLVTADGNAAKACYTKSRNCPPRTFGIDYQRVNVQLDRRTKFATPRPTAASQEQDLNGMAALDAVVDDKGAWQDSHGHFKYRSRCLCHTETSGFGSETMSFPNSSNLLKWTRVFVVKQALKHRKLVRQKSRPRRPFLYFFQLARRVRQMIGWYFHWRLIKFRKLEFARSGRLITRDIDIGHNLDASALTR